jgi:hypothetical protein
MRCLRTLFHEETALLSVRKIPFPELTRKSQHEEQLLVRKTRRRKSAKNIHRQNGRQKSIFTPAESHQFQIGTRNPYWVLSQLPLCSPYFAIAVLLGRVA